MVTYTVDVKPDKYASSPPRRRGRSSVCGDFLCKNHGKSLSSYAKRAVLMPVCSLPIFCGNVPLSLQKQTPPKTYV